MYAALWRALPGPWWVKLILLLLLITAVLTVCVLWVFPWIDQFLVAPEVTVEE